MHYLSDCPATAFRTAILTPVLLLALAASGCTKDPPIPDGSSLAPATETPPNVPGIPNAPNPNVLNAATRPFADYSLLAWSDEFDGSALDGRKWRPEVKDVWYNNELQATTASRSNLGVAGGNLLLTAQREALNGRQYTSARIVTKGLKSFLYGRIDTRAKLPKGKGMWPAIWMLGANDSQVSWPACGEIDIMELKGSQPTLNISTLHFGATVAAHQYQSGTYTLPQPPAGPAVDFSTDFHVFTVIRSLNTIRWYLDGNLYYTRSSAEVSPYPFNNPFYMILNVAVGGDFDGNPDATTVFPQAMQVDYVRYFKYAE